MNYALSRPSASRRSSLLSIVIGAHAGIALFVAAVKTVAPQVAEMPLIVDLLHPPAEVRKEPEAKPVARPQPVRPKPLPQTPQAPIEATTSSLPAPAAPVAVPAEARPTPPGPVAEAVTQARFDADYLRNPAPYYPPLSKRLGEEGKVILRVAVNPQGATDNIEIKVSSGSQRLDDAALNTVRTWKFIPAKRGDVAVPSWVLVPIIFKLEH